MDEIAVCPFDREAARITGEPFGGLAAEWPGALDERRLVVAQMHDQRRRAAPDTTTVAAAALGECDERVGGGLLPVGDAACLLVGGALLLGDVPDRLLEDGALLERQPAAQTQLASSARPRHAQSPSRIQRLVVGDHGRRERPRDQPDRARRLADRDPRQLGIALGRRELRGRRDLIERQRARTQRMVERRQAPQRDARAA